MPPPQSTSLARKVTTLSFRTAREDTLGVPVCSFKISPCFQTPVHVPLLPDYSTTLPAPRLSTTSHIQSDPPILPPMQPLRRRLLCHILWTHPLPGNTPHPPNHLPHPRLENTLKSIPANFDIEPAVWGYLARIKVFCSHPRSCNPQSLQLHGRKIAHLINSRHSSRCAKSAFRPTHLIPTSTIFARAP
jgi:hypothetical protein